jgi:Family of unknown function (DUF6328)
MTEEQAGEERRELEEEDEKERTQRQLIELLNELRVVIPGVQVLFAFLLTIPFNQRFGRVDELQETIYFVTLLLAALASVLFMAPTAYHRLLFHQGDRKHIIEVANRFAIAGLGVLTLAITGAVCLVTDFLYNDKAMVAGVTGGTLLAFAVFWIALPLVRRARINGGQSG